MKQQADRKGTSVVLLANYAGGELRDNPGQSTDMIEVVRHARSSGIEVIDTWDQWRSLLKADQDAFRSQFRQYEGSDMLGHWTVEGNRLVAETVARRWIEDAGLGDNLLRAAGIGDLRGCEVVVEAAPPVQGRHASYVSLRPTPNLSEHYAVMDWVGHGPGKYFFTMVLDIQADTAIRIQLHDDRGGVAIGDYRASDDENRQYAFGTAWDLTFLAKRDEDGVRISFSARLKGSRGTVIIQLLRSDWSTVFEGGVPTVSVGDLAMRAGA